MIVMGIKLSGPVGFVEKGGLTPNEGFFVAISGQNQTSLMKSGSLGPAIGIWIFT